MLVDNPPLSIDFLTLELQKFGHVIQVAGVIYGDEDKLYLCLLPDDHLDGRKLFTLNLTQGDWVQIIKQTDLLETEVLAQASDGKIAKVIVRKSTRQIEQGVSWNVYRRDGYRCRYCWNDKVPLTVDHLVLWEEGGPSIEANLVSCCRKCNKTRGKQSYADWLQSPFYRKVSKGLPGKVQQDNEALLVTLDAIPRKLHVVSR